MSTTLYEDESFSVTRFYGGADRGVCLQIENAGGYVCLTLADAAKLADVVRAATDGVSVPRDHPNTPAPTDESER